MRVALKQLKEQRKPPPKPEQGHESLDQASQFKTYFGFKDQLLERKEENDKSLSLHNKKQGFSVVIVGSVLVSAGLFLYIKGDSAMPLKYRQDPVVLEMLNVHKF